MLKSRFIALLFVCIIGLTFGQYTSSNNNYNYDYTSSDYPSTVNDYFGGTATSDCALCNNNNNIGNVNRPSSGSGLDNFFDFGNRGRDRFRNGQRRRSAFPQNVYTNWQSGNNLGNSNPFGLLSGFGSGAFNPFGNMQGRSTGYRGRFGQSSGGRSSYNRLRSRLNNLRSGQRSNRQVSSNCFDYLS